MSNLDPFVSCPYDIVHRVPRSRLQAHIVKCQKNHNKLQICPYNALHRFPENEIREHCANCPDKDALYPETGLRPTLQSGGEIDPTPSCRKNVPETDPNHEWWDD